MEDFILKSEGNFIFILCIAWLIVLIAVINLLCAIIEDLAYKKDKKKCFIFFCVALFIAFILQNVYLYLY